MKHLAHIYSDIKIWYIKKLRVLGCETDNAYKLSRLFFVKYFKTLLKYFVEPLIGGGD